MTQKFATHMTQKVNKHYGFTGWREILRVRKDLLDAYDKAKEYNASRPVKAEHGNVGEAEIRSWLSSFLPSKYGVTSGYIIPGIICQEYVLLSYDVIIYDQIDSPILWIDDNPDHSEQGRKRAIPAKYVHAVFEVKSRLTSKDAKDAINKLQELNYVSKHLPRHFSSAAIFFELDPTLAEKKYIIKHLIPDNSIVGFWGGMILRCAINPNMTGYFFLCGRNKDSDSMAKAKNALVKDVDKLPVWVRPDGSGITLGGPGIGASVFPDGDVLHVGKSYTCSMTKEDYGDIVLSWSYNNFADFMIKLLLRLERKIERDDLELMIFGQVFDVLDTATESA